MKLNKKKSVLTIGTFDGVHLGHQKILRKIVYLSGKEKLISAVLTFFPHPRMVLQGGQSIKLLNTIDERIDLLKAHGIESLTVKPFTREFAALPAKAYVEQILIEELSAKYIVVGYDHRFGKNRSAGIKELNQYAKIYGFETKEISAKDIDEVTISSTKIRNALDEGLVSLANSFLGYNYFLTGKVVKGERLGRTIGFPTANIFIRETYKLIPKDGAYIISSIIDGIVYYGMMNIGTNPTIEDKPRSIEVHFFDFNADIYGKTLKISILERLRDEQKFESIKSLKIQLAKDKKDALNYIKSKT